MKTQFYYKPALEVRASEVEILFHKLLEERLIEESNLRGKVLDIGFGYGGSYAALRKFSSDIMGVEQDNELREILVNSGFVDRAMLVTSPTLEYLKSKADETFEFIAGLLLSYDDKQKIGELYEESLRLLKSGGQVMFSTEKDPKFPESAYKLENLLKINRRAASISLDLKKLECSGQDNFVFIATKTR